MTTPKRYHLRADQIEELAPGYGACIATDEITVAGRPVGFMYRQEPETADDSGWRFMAGTESREYMDDPDNQGFYDVNTIANHDREIILLLDAPPGSAFERDERGELMPVVFAPPG